MKKKRATPKPVFKEYNQDQMWLLPPSIDELVPQNHVVRTVNQAIDAMNIDFMLSRYRGGGCSSYHPKMMLKVLIYAYTQKIYTSRMIAKALRENVHFMWIAGRNRPDFRTINRFRAQMMHEMIEKVFAAVVELLLEKGFVSFEHYFLDGTKIEAASNKYSFVWKKSVEKNKAKLEEKIKETLTHIDEANNEENHRYGERDLEELGEDATVTAEEIEEVVKRLNEELNQKDDAEDEKKELKTIEEEYLPRLQKYENQLETCGSRNSYSKTDHDATFMRMKEDHMLNGQLKPGYNVQIGTENRFILGYSIHQKPTDTTTLIPHLEKVKQKTGHVPSTVIADAGYGSEENYAYLEKKRIDSYVKFNYFHMENKRKFRKNPFRKENLPYDSATDSFTCPAGQRLAFAQTKSRRSENGYEQTLRVYECEDCRWCRSRNVCHSSRFNRRIEINPTLDMFRAMARKKLTSETGRNLLTRRSVEVETVFGDIKHNRRFRRFLLRGLEKVGIEWGLICTAHNFLKMNQAMA